MTIFLTMLDLVWTHFLVFLNRKPPLHFHLSLLHFYWALFSNGKASEHGLEAKA